jgi:signal transduction histidine kinase
MKVLLRVVLCIVALAGSDAGVAAERGTRDEAVAMVKKAVVYLKENGRDKAFAEFDNRSGQFADRDLYIVVYDMNGKNLAHGGNSKMIGKSLIDIKDVNGKSFMKERIEIARVKGKGWQDYVFLDPVSKLMEPKSMYIEKFEDLIVGCGIYNPK